MKVRGLIERLSKLDPDLEVEMDVDGGTIPIEDILNAGTIIYLCDYDVEEHNRIHEAWLQRYEEEKRKRLEPYKDVLP